MALTPKNSSLDKAAKAKAAEADVFQREVDDALRQDRMEVFFKRFGLLVAGLVVLLLAALGGFFYWQHERTKTRESNAEAFVQALDNVQATKLDDAKAELAPLAANADAAQAAAATVMEADIALKQGKNADAIKLLDSVSNNTKAPQPLRDLATVRSVTANYDALKPQQVIDRLKPLAEPGNAWFGSAGELVAAAYVAQGKKDQAGPIFAAIAKDDTQPKSLRNRARQLAAVYGVDAVDDIVDADGKAIPDTSAAPAAKATTNPAPTGTTAQKAKAN